MPSPADLERRRLARLRMLAVLDTEPEPVFDALVRVAASLCGVPISLISLIDERRQWFKANEGLTDRSETPRTVAFCDHAIRSPGETMEVHDATLDARFAQNPLVTGAPNIRFYAGAPIVMPGGEAVGTLCVIGREPHELSQQQRDALADLASVARQCLLQRERLHDLTVVGDETRFQAISFASPLGIFQADEQGNFFHVSGRLAELFGMSPGRAQGLGWQDVVAEPDRSRVREAWSRAVTFTHEFNEEFRLHRFDGSEIEVRMQGRPGRWGEPPRNGFVGVVADITTRQEALRAQQRANTLLSAVIENIPCGLAVYDAQMSVVAHNRQFAELLDLPVELLAGPSPRLEDIVRFNARRGEYAEGSDEAAVRLIVDQARYISERRTERTRPNGTTIEIRGAPMPHGGWVTTYVDVTAARRAGAALRASEERLTRALAASKAAEAELARAAAITRATLESTADGILVMNDMRDILLFNRPFLTIWRIPPELERASAAEMLDFVLHQVKDPEAFRSRVDELFSRSDSEAVDVLEFKDGRSVERYLQPIVLAEGSIGRVWTFRDVTLREQAERQIKQAREAAEASNRAKSDFLHNVSHEIRTPLNGVLGMTRLLLAEQLSSRQRKYVELADASAASLLALINDLLDLGKIEAGRLELEQIQFPLEALLQQLGELYQIAARQKGLAFSLDIGPRVPPHVLGDPVRVRQVLNNLLGNALKFTARGGIGLRVECTATGVRFEVHDSGSGIAPEAQSRLFGRFAQADSSTTRTHGGTGLGLAIVKQLCEQMGGRVDLRSEAGHGSVFGIELPLQASEDADSESAHAPLMAVAEKRHARILVAEDNPTNQVVVQGLLSLAGYDDVTVVADGLQAVGALESDSFDLVLMDCRMPGLDGYEATQALRSRGHKLPVIALTANASQAERDRCLASGMNDFLSKPVDEKQLAAMVARWTTGTPPPAAPAAPRKGNGEDDGYDRARTLAQLGGDTELMQMALESFRLHGPGYIDKIRTALSRMDGGELHRSLHSLAGSAGMMAATPLRTLAKALEERVEQGELDDLESGIDELGALVDRFLSESAGW